MVSLKEESTGIAEVNYSHDGVGERWEIEKNINLGYDSINLCK